MDFEFDVALLHPADDHDFLDLFSYATESWFTLPHPSYDFKPLSTPFQPKSFPTLPSSEPKSLQSFPAPEVITLPLNLVNEQAQPIATDAPNLKITLPLVQRKRSISQASTVASPELKKSTISQPISPPSTERRRLRAYSSSSGQSSEESSADESRTKRSHHASRKRARTTATLSHTSVFRGVSCCGKDRKFQARIRDGSKVHYLGRFDNEFDAAIKYDTAARSHKGDSAVPNFIEMTDEEAQKLKAHYYSNGQQFSPEYHSFLYQGTLERLELKKRIR